MDQLHKIAIGTAVSSILLCLIMVKMIGNDLTDLGDRIDNLSGAVISTNQKLGDMQYEVTKGQYAFEQYQTATSGEISSIMTRSKLQDRKMDRLSNFLSDPDKCPKEGEIWARFIEMDRIEGAPVGYGHYRVDAPGFDGTVIDKEGKGYFYGCVNIYRVNDF